MSANINFNREGIASYVENGKKERALLEAMINGRVKPTDSLATIKKKMDSTMVRSRQSWAIAFNRLIENGDLG